MAREGTRNLAYFCVEDSRIRELVDELDEIITMQDFHDIQNQGLRLGLDYHVGMLAVEGPF